MTIDGMTVLHKEALNPKYSSHKEIVLIRRQIKEGRCITY